VVVLLPPRVFILFTLRLPRVFTLRVPRAFVLRWRLPRLRARAVDAVEERGRGERQQQGERARPPRGAGGFAATPRSRARVEGVVASHLGVFLKVLVHERPTAPPLTKAPGACGHGFARKAPPREGVRRRVSR